MHPNEQHRSFKLGEFVCSIMTNKIQLMTALTLATILIAGGFSLAPQAFSTGSGGDDEEKKDKKGGEDSNKYKDWKKENDKHDDDDEEHDKVKICHIPPGNEENAHTIEISESALASHLDHGDTLGACPDDDDEEEEPANLIIIRAITDDNNKAYNTDDFTISIDDVVQDLGLPIPIVPKTDHIITGTVPEGYKFVLIAGDPACPVNIDSDTFSLKKGQTIVCTIYYDDLFVEGGAVGPNPTITIVNNVASDPQPFDITISPTVGDPEIINPTTTKYTIDSHTTVTISGSDDRSVLIIGDGNCPENVGGFVNIESGQDITCIYSDRPIDDGTFFVRKSVQIDVQSSQLAESTSPHGCSEVPFDVIRPCVTTSSSFLLLVDEKFEEQGAEFAIVIVTLQPTNGEMRVGECTGVVGVDEFTYPGTNPVQVKGFLINCPGLVDNGLFNLNYALSKTTLVPLV